MIKTDSSDSAADVSFAVGLAKPVGVLEMIFLIPRRVLDGRAWSESALGFRWTTRLTPLQCRRRPTSGTIR